MSLFYFRRGPTSPPQPLTFFFNKFILCTTYLLRYISKPTQERHNSNAHQTHVAHILHFTFWLCMLYAYKSLSDTSNAGFHYLKTTLMRTKFTCSLTILQISQIPVYILIVFNKHQFFHRVLDNYVTVFRNVLRRRLSNTANAKTNIEKEAEIIHHFTKKNMNWI